MVSFNELQILVRQSVWGMYVKVFADCLLSFFDCGYKHGDIIKVLFKKRNTHKQYHFLDFDIRDNSVNVWKYDESGDFSWFHRRFDFVYTELILNNDIKSLYEYKIMLPSSVSNVLFIGLLLLAAVLSFHN